MCKLLFICKRKRDANNIDSNYANFIGGDFNRKGILSMDTVATGLSPLIWFGLLMAKNHEHKLLQKPKVHGF